MILLSDLFTLNVTNNYYLFRGLRTISSSARKVDWKIVKVNYDIIYTFT